MAGVMGCIVEGCGKVKRNRGLCTTHYARLYNRVRAGEVTWEELAASGECLPDGTAAAKAKFYDDGRKSSRRYKKE